MRVASSGLAGTVCQAHQLGPRSLGKVGVSRDQQCRKIRPGTARFPHDVRAAHPGHEVISHQRIDFEFAAAQYAQGFRP